MSLKDSIKKTGGKLVNQLSGEEVVPTEEEKQPVDTSAADTAEGTEAAGKPQGTDKALQQKKIIFGVVAAIIVIAGIFFYMRANSGPSAVSINLIDLVTVQTTGVPMNGHGELTAALDLEKTKAALTQIAAEGTSKETINNIAERIVAASAVSLSDRERLTNGDVVTVSVAFDKEQASSFSGLTFVDGSMTYTVSGLSDAIVLDPFSPDLMEVVIAGNSGSATATLNIKSSASYITFLHYDVSPTKGLSNGDKVTVAIAPNAQRLIEMGYTVSANEEDWKKEILVTGLNETVASVDSIPASLINSMVSYAESNLYKSYSAVTINEGDIVEEPVISSIYFLDKIDKTVPYTNYFKKLEMTNAIVILGKFSIQTVTNKVVGEGENATTTQEVTRSYGGYYAYIFPNLVLDGENNVSYSRNMIVAWPTNYQTEVECLNWIKGEFTDFSITEIGSNNTGT